MELLNVELEQESILETASELTTIISISDDIKQALLQCFNHVAWVDDQGQTYYDALYDALYPPVDLSFISCVYTQSGTVYDTDTLDSLKPDLVVTAHYTDQSTQTITTYTLSGTLTEGTSTITVMYGGKSTTFTVTVTEWVPITQSISWSGTGSDNTATIIDATQYDAYLTVPFVADDSHLGESAVDGGNAYKARGIKLYTDPSATDEYLFGYYYIAADGGMGVIEEEQRTTANAPWANFGSEYLVVPRGYYGKLLFAKSGTGIFVDNAGARSYLNAHMTSVEMR